MIVITTRGHEMCVKGACVCVTCEYIRKEQVRFDSFRFGVFSISLCFGLVRFDNYCSGFMRFRLRFSDAPWLGLVRFRIRFRPVPKLVNGLVRFSSARSVRFLIPS